MLKFLLNICVLFAIENAVFAQKPVAGTTEEKSLFKITKRTDSHDNYTKVSVYAKDIDAKLPMLATVGLLDKKDTLLLNFFTDKSGFAQINLFDFSQVNYLYVDYIGYFGVKIPISDLKGKSSTIEVFLKGQDIIDRSDQ